MVILKAGKGKAMTHEDMKMVSGGTLMGGLVKLVGGSTDGGMFKIGDRVLDKYTMWHGTITEDSYDYGHGIWLYTVKFDGGPTYSSIPEDDLQAE